MTARWRQLENYLTGTAMLGQAFRSIDLAQDLAISTSEASTLIQAHLGAQRQAKSTTAYVLHRTGRTRNAIWHVGTRTQDARILSRQYLDDIRLRVRDAVNPDLTRIGVLNPRATQLTDAIANAIEANLQLLAAAL